MKYTKVFLALVFLFNILFSQHTLAQDVATSLSPMDKINQIKNFKDLEALLEFMKLKFSREELSFLRNRFLAAGFQLKESLNFKIDVNEKSVFVPQIGKTIKILNYDEVSIDGLIFKFDFSLPLDQNLRKFEKLLNQKGYGKIEISFSTAEADLEAAWGMVAGSAATAATLLYLLSVGPVIAIAAGVAVAVLGAYLVLENKPGGTISPQPGSLSQKDLGKALTLMQEIRCNPERRFSNMPRSSEFQIVLKDGSSLSVQVDVQGMASAMKKISKDGATEYRIALPESRRADIGVNLNSYCALKPQDKEKLKPTLEKLRSAFAYQLDNSNARPAAVGK